MTKTMKTLKLRNKDADKLIELMNRGLAYTDAYHYRDYKSQEKLFSLIKNQIINYVPNNKTITIKNSN